MMNGCRQMTKSKQQLPGQASRDANCSWLSDLLCPCGIRLIIRMLYVLMG